MAIIVEDGTVIANANSYIDDAFLTAYAAERGLTLPATVGEREVLLINAMDYIESYADKFKGQRTDPANQELQWPREDVTIYGEDLDKNTIPKELKRAHAQAAVEASNADLFFKDDGTRVKKEKLDVLEVEYFEGGSSGQPFFEKVTKLIDPLLSKSSGSLRLTRV